MRLIHSLFLIILHKFLMYPFLKIIIGMEVLKNKSLNEDKYIIVSNHSSHTDTSAILSILPFSKIIKLRPIAAKDYFTENIFFKAFTRIFYNAIFIDRVTKDGKKESVETMSLAIDQGENLLIFPEGSRVSDENIGPFKIGVAKLLKKKPEIPFIPIYIESSANTLPKGDALLIPHNFKIIVGDKCFIDSKKSEKEVLEDIRSEVLMLSNGV